MLADWDKGGKNLNKISHDSAIGLIKKIRDEVGFKVKRVYLDTVGDPKKYKDIISRALNDPEILITVESKADDTYPVVSAASICAKVTRDHALREFQFQEVGKKFGTDTGCGYPSDPKTKTWLKENIDPVYGFPSLVRFSWKTSYSMLEANDTKADWFDGIQDPGQTQNFNKTEFNR